jgi:hypothetical protein
LLQIEKMAVSKYEAYEYLNPMKLVVFRPDQKDNLRGKEELQEANSSPKAYLEFSPMSKKNGKPIPRFAFHDLEFSVEQHPSSKSPHGIRFFYLTSPHNRL